MIKNIVAHLEAVLEALDALAGKLEAAAQG